MKPFKLNTAYRTFLLFVLLASGLVFADEDPISPMYSPDSPEPQADLSARPLAGKVVRYGYHTFWEVNKNKGVQGTPAALKHDLFFYTNGECEWFSLDIFAGEHARSPCGTVEVAPNIYQVSWLEDATKQVVTQTLNMNTWRINTSFHFKSGKGLALFQGKIYSFGDIPKPPVTEPENIPKPNF